MSPSQDSAIAQGEIMRAEELERDLASDVTATPEDYDVPLRILIATDAWVPQVNGVVRTLETLCGELDKLGHTVKVLEPRMFRTLPLPSYPEIRIALRPVGRTEQILDAFRPDAIHIATEGPIGWAARAYCLKRGLPFTTSFHTRFPEYLHARTRFPPVLTYRLLKFFHWPAAALLVTTNTLKAELECRGFRNIRIWARGVDVDAFRPRPELRAAADLPRPIFTYVGRVAIEKNIEALLKLDLPGSKVIIGDGPQFATLKARYPDAHFTGVKVGEDLARAYATSDVFVFPSRTDTYGLVVLEALSSGVPVAAYPVQGPADILAGAPSDAPVGIVHDDLRIAALEALKISRERCRQFALGFSWEACAREFVSHLHCRDVYRRRWRRVRPSRAAPASLEDRAPEGS